MKRVIEFIPDELNEIVDYQEIGYAIDNYHDNIVERLLQIKLNQDILTANEKTIERLERRMKITPKVSETLDERRYRCWIHQTTHTPFTEQWLRHWLKDFIGEENYRLDFNYEARTFLLKLSLSNAVNYESVAALLDEVVPTKIMYIISYLFNDWQEVYDKYNWESISQWTWEDVYSNDSF